MNLRRLLVVLSLLAAFMAGCNATTPRPQPLNSPAAPALSPLASPLAAPSNGMPFQLDRPVVAGTTVVRGTGPAGVPIFIADVTFMGEPLGTGNIGADGKFAITVQSLEAQHRIGLALGILDGTAWKPDDFYQPEFYGPDAMQLPQVGFFHDTVLVDEK